MPNPFPCVSFEYGGNLIKQHSPIRIRENGLERTKYNGSLASPSKKRVSQFVGDYSWSCDALRLSLPEPKLNISACPKCKVRFGSRLTRRGETTFSNRVCADGLDQLRSTLQTPHWQGLGRRIRCEYPTVSREHVPQHAERSRST
jgi:hypothetical protein